ncbi:MAG: hypothetical protein AB8F78_09515 [Saprospiraceae bacterium]
MKFFTISRYRMGKEEYVEMPKGLVQEIVDEDPSLNWYEDVDDYFRQRQTQRKTPAWRICFVFNYVPRPGSPEFKATFAEGTDDIIVKVFHPRPEGLDKIKEIAEKLSATLYKV